MVDRYSQLLLHHFDIKCIDMVMKKSQVVAERLLERVLSSSPGTRLPSIRSLMRIHGASLHSVGLAVRRFQEEGLIEAKRGSGIFVTAKKGIRYVELHRPLHPSVTLDLKERSLSLATERAGWQLLVKHHRVGGEPSELAINAKASAHIVMLDPFASSLLFHRETLGHGIPVLAYGQMSLDHRMDCVTGDDHQYMSMLAKHLCSLGHRRFALVANEPGFPHLPQRSEMLSRILDLLDLPAPVLVDCHTQPGECSALKAYEGLRGFLEGTRPKPPFTALITASASGVVGSLRALHEVGLRVPQDCSVASFGLSFENAILVPSVTEVGVEENAWGDAAVKVLQQRFADRQAPPITAKLAPVLRARESTGPAPA